MGIGTLRRYHEPVDADQPEAPEAPTDYALIDDAGLLALVDERGLDKPAEGTTRDELITLLSADDVADRGEDGDDEGGAATEPGTDGERLDASGDERVGEDQDEQAATVDSAEPAPVAEAVHGVIAEQADATLEPSAEVEASKVDEVGDAPEPAKVPARSATRKVYAEYIEQLPEGDRPVGWEDKTRDELAEAIHGPKA